MLKLPGVLVWQKDGIETSGESRIDVGFGTVADHPGGGVIAAMAGGKGAVGGLVLFGKRLQLRRSTGRGRNAPAWRSARSGRLL